MPLDTKKIFSERVVVWALLTGSIALWFLVFAQYLTGAPAMTRHGVDYYFIIKHYMDNLMQGVFPLWDPYGGWGRPDEVDLRFIGEFNPFLWVYAVLRWLHISSPVAFLLYCFVYFQAGVIGFYFLAYRFFHDRWLALLSAVLFMFSSHTFVMFNNYCVNLIIIPVIWFFYYLLAFGQEPRRHFFLGWMFSSAIIAMTYMPFYFLTLCLPFVLGMAILYFKETKDFLGKTGRFILGNRIFSSLSFVFLALASVPALAWFWASSQGETILSWRHQGSSSAHTASMGANVIQGSSFNELMSLRALFPSVDDWHFFVFFLSIFIAVALLLSLINKINRRQILLMLVGVWLFLIALGEFTPVHPFLFKHIFIFRLFRNLIYFIYFLIPVLILFTIEQLRLLISSSRKSRVGKAGMLVYVWLVHACLLMILLKSGKPFSASYLALGLSVLFFTFHELGVLGGNKALKFSVLWLIAVLQPLQFFSFYARHYEETFPWTVAQPYRSAFSYSRPAFVTEEHIKGNAPPLLESSGFAPWKFTGLRWSYDLQQNIKKEILEPYSHYKFVAYDRVKVMEPVDYGRLAGALAVRENTAFISPGISGAEDLASDLESTASQAELIGPDHPFLEVKEFDLNGIKFQTGFPSRKFLVYNDSFHKWWKATVNDKPAMIYRANGAFKGVWLPAGPNEVVFKYGALWQYGLYGTLLVLFPLTLGYLVWLTIKSAKAMSVIRRSS